jgi:hypothetical protein
MAQLEGKYKYHKEYYRNFLQASKEIALQVSIDKTIYMSMTQNKNL